jgi:hypothetical protein
MAPSSIEEELFYLRGDSYIEREVWVSTINKRAPFIL